MGRFEDVRKGYASWPGRMPVWGMSEGAWCVRTHVVLVHKGEQLIVVLRLLGGCGMSGRRAGGTYSMLGP